MLFPVVDQLRAGRKPPFPQSLVTDFLRKDGIASLDLYETFKGREKQVLMDSMHLSPAGHALAAEAIARYLE